MTELLDKAFADASKLPKSQQDELATWILGELAARRQRQDQVPVADRVAEEAAGYHKPAQGLSLGEAELKGLFKQALLELLQEQGDLVRELVAQIVEDAAMVGAIVMALLAATAMFVLVRFRGSAVGIYGLRGRQFGVNPRGWFHPRMPGRWLGFGAMLCGPVLLLAGAMVLGALLGKYWHSHRQGKQVQSGRQPSSVDKPVEAEQPSVSEAVVAEQEPPAEAGQSGAKG